MRLPPLPDLTIAHYSGETRKLLLDYRRAVIEACAAECDAKGDECSARGDDIHAGVAWACAERVRALLGEVDQ